MSQAAPWSTERPPVSQKGVRCDSASSASSDQGSAVAPHGQPQAGARRSKRASAGFQRTRSPACRGQGRSGSTHVLPQGCAWASPFVPVETTLMASRTVSVSRLCVADGRIEHGYEHAHSLPHSVRVHLHADPDRL